MTNVIEQQKTKHFFNEYLFKIGKLQRQQNIYGSNETQSTQHMYFAFINCRETIDLSRRRILKCLMKWVVDVTLMKKIFGNCWFMFIEPYKPCYLIMFNSHQSFKYCIYYCIGNGGMSCATGPIYKLCTYKLNTTTIISWKLVWKGKDFNL